MKKLVKWASPVDSSLDPIEVVSERRMLAMLKTPSTHSMRLLELFQKQAAILAVHNVNPALT